MRTQRLLVGTITLFTLAGFATPAFAHGRGRITRPDQSCVDVDNNGVCDAGDPALAPLLADGFFDTSVAEPGWTPRATPVGVILHNFVVTKSSGGAAMKASGDVRFEERVGGENEGLHLDVSAGLDISVDPKTTVAVGDEMHLHADRTVHLGARSWLFVPGRETEGLTVDGAVIQIDDNAKLSAGGMYSGVHVSALQLTLGENVGMTTAPRGELDVKTFSNLAATSWKVHAGGISISALAPSANDARVISLTDSSIINTYTSSSVALYAGSSTHTHNAGDAIHLVHSRVKSHHDGNVYFDPLPS